MFTHTATHNVHRHTQITKKKNFHKPKDDLLFKMEDMKLLNSRQFNVFNAQYHTEQLVVQTCCLYLGAW